MKKLGTLAVAGLMICAGHTAWAQSCPINQDFDGDGLGAHDADFLNINTVFSEDDTSIADNAAALSGGNAGLQAYFETAVIPSIIWLSLLEDAVTDTNHPNHATVCQTFVDNLAAFEVYEAATIAEIPAMSLLWPQFPEGNEMIAGLMTLNHQLWGPIIDAFIQDAAADSLSANLTTTLNGSATFATAPEMMWDATVGTNTNTNVEIWLGLGATWDNDADAFAVDSGGGKAIFFFTEAQVYNTYALAVADDGQTDLLSLGIIPGVPTGAPVSGPIGLGLLALAVAGGGALMIRRRK
jgi:hypothetical protein